MADGVNEEKNGVQTETISTEHTYWSQEVADTLDITTSTLRRWSIDLEKAGYRFYRDQHNRRAYFERDLKPLRKLKELINNKVSMADATKTVVAMFPQDQEASFTLPVHEEESDEQRFSKRELEETVQAAVAKALEDEREKQKELYKELFRQMDQQQEILADRLQERDQHLLAAIHELRDTKKQIPAPEPSDEATSLSDSRESKEDPKETKKKWYEFWK